MKNKSELFWYFGFFYYLCGIKQLKQIKMEKKIKAGDIFSFKYNDAIVEIAGHDYLYHCFDGQLIASEVDGEIILEDTYWMSGNNKKFTVDAALEKGELVFKCNINDVEKVGRNDLQYYADEDLFNLSYQHGCYPHFVKRIGANKSAEKMLAVLREKRYDKVCSIEYASREIERIDECIAKLNNGEVDGIYI